MVKLPHKPTNLREYKCDLVINSQHFTKLEISPYYEKHNQEYLDALKRKSAKLSAKELAKKLITDDLIRKVLVPQLDAYKLIWCCDENNLHILGVMDCFRVEKFDKDD
ncbi:3799_t:CDS:2 [Entrophospora sp. SA101]|nr:3799_t:CDS:2 [Entrophospora sp. SA101]